jgi:hypothetical protein
MFRREYLCVWNDDTLYVDLARIKTLVDVDKLRGKRPERIMFSGSVTNPLDPVIRYLAQILETMVADGAVVVDSDRPEGIVVFVHDVPEGMAADELVRGVRSLKASEVWVDSAGIGQSVLQLFESHRIPAKAIPKVPRR